MVNHQTLMAEKNALIIKSLAKELGFDYCGISKAAFLEEEAPRLEKWLKEQRHGEMTYMENHFEKRLNPTLLVPDAQSVVSLLYNYFPEDDLAKKSNSLKISKYAYGVDYHKVIKKKLTTFLERISQEIGQVSGRAFVDSAPVLEKAWAKKSGIGWVGKNVNLITKEQGSFFFLAELIIDLPLAADVAIKDYCGTCTRCLDACPTDALFAPYEIDGSKCISYLTIELKNEIPARFQNEMDNWVFGCDICQDVCPWNRFSKPHKEQQFIPSQLLQETYADGFKVFLSEQAEKAFEIVFERSAIKRTKLLGFQRNLKFIREKHL